MSAATGRDFVLRLGPLDAATAAWVLDFCGHLQHAIWRAYGDEIEAHWAATEPEQPISGPLPPPPSNKRCRRRRATRGRHTEDTPR